MAQIKDLHEFLAGAELQHYYNSFVKDLKVNTVPQIKYVEDDDLMDVGMTKPEIRRLRQFFKKECPKGTLTKLKKMLVKSQNETNSSNSPPVQDKTQNPLKHIIPEDSIVVQRTLGTGEFGIVQQGVWTKETGEQLQVAVKCLPKERLKAQTSEFLHEATNMHSIDHPNIVQLYGVVLGSENFMLVTELAPLRSLLECLKEVALRSNFTVSLLCDLAVQLADGMAYLESRRLIHRDLAARNVLMFSKDKVKISDFGLSRALGVGSDYYQGHLNTGLKLPIAWCAPECVNFLKFTSSSDVWAYGVTLWELFSYGTQPWAGSTGLEIMQMVDAPNFKRLSQPELCPDEWYSTMIDCWRAEPNDRPKFSDLLTNLPQLKPSQVIMTKDLSKEDSSTSNGYLHYKANDVVTILSKVPEKSPKPGMWRGVVESTGQSGLFEQSNSSPYIEVVASGPVLRKIKLNRTESARSSSRLTRKITPSMISNPQADLRHIGHVGYDGVVFGDVSFIGDNYDKLPLKVGNTHKSDDDMRSSCISLPINGNSRTDLDRPGVGMSISSTTLSSESRPVDDDDEFADFKLPDFSSDFDMGSSLMDEVMKALSASSAHHDDIQSLLSGFDSKTETLPPPVAAEPVKEDTSETSSNATAGPESDESASESEEEEQKDENNSLFESSSCSSHDVFDDYNGLRRTDDSSSDKNSKCENSSIDKSMKEDLVEFKIDIKPASPTNPSRNGNVKKLAVDDETRSKKSNESFESNNLDVVVRTDQRKSSSSEGKHSSSDEGNSRNRMSSFGKSMPTESTKLNESALSSSVVVGAGEGSTVTSVSRTTRSVNQNIRAPQGIPRAPQGIPGRETARKPFLNPSAVTVVPRAAAVQDSADDAEVDTNPLRRLRDCQPGSSRPMMSFRPLGGSKSERPVADAQQSHNLNINLSFFDKLKEQEQGQS